MKSCVSVRTGRISGQALFGTAAAILACLAIAAVAVQANVGAPGTGPGVANLQQSGESFAEVTKKTSPAVVFIQVEKRIQTAGAATPFDDAPGWFNDDFLKRFFGDRMPKFRVPERPWHSTGQGSGFIISKDGYILTNSHVVGGADKVTVTLADEREFDAKIIGTDVHTDVAIIKIDGKNLPTLPMGNSDDIEVGQWVLAVGSPFGLPGTVTSGIVSAKGRSRVGIADYENFIQTDAAINPGNSGGPLLNLRGEAIGINTAIFSRSGGYMGIGFAIPINMARDVCDQLIETGSVTRGYLGIAVQDLTADLASSFGTDGTNGVLIGDVTKGSPADEAGMKPGDVILEFNGARVEEVGEFRNRVARTSPDTSATVVVWRDGKRQTLTVNVGKLDSNDSTQSATTDDVHSLGMTVAPLTSENREQYGYKDDSGVVVTDVEPGSHAARAGIQPGWLITEVNRQSIDSVEQFSKAVKDSSDSGTLLLRVKNGEYSRYLTLKWNDK